jgi:hypothetical protein
VLGPDSFVTRLVPSEVLRAMVSRAPVSMASSPGFLRQGTARLSVAVIGPWECADQIDENKKTLARVGSRARVMTIVIPVPIAPVCRPRASHQCGGAAF